MNKTGGEHTGSEPSFRHNSKQTGCEFHLEHFTFNYTEEPEKSDTTGENNWRKSDISASSKSEKPHFSFPFSLIPLKSSFSFVVSISYLIIIANPKHIEENLRFEINNFYFNK